MNRYCPYNLRSRVQNSTMNQLLDQPIDSEDSQPLSRSFVSEPLRSRAQSSIAVNRSTALIEHYFANVVEIGNVREHQTLENPQSEPSNLQPENTREENTLANPQPGPSILQPNRSQSMSPQSRSTYYTSDEDQADTDTASDTTVVPSFYRDYELKLQQIADKRAEWDGEILRAVQADEKDKDAGMSDMPEPVCPICLQDMRLKTLQIFTLRCGHMGHHRCLEQYVETESNSCPVCRQHFSFRDGILSFMSYF